MPKSKKDWDQDRLKWEQENADRLNSIGENLRAAGIGIGTAQILPPLNPDGSLKAETESPTGKETAS